MYSKTDKSIMAWLQTSTGCAMCDSGGEDGRAWQRNQKLKLADFMKQTAEVEINLHKNEKGEKSVYFCGVIPMFHYLRQLMCEVEIDDVCKRYRKWLDTNHDWEIGENGCFTADEALEYAGLIIPEDPYKNLSNTYNGEDCLSQVMQYNSFRHAKTGETYICISIHGGADVRGGYTVGRLFKLNDQPTSQYHKDANAYLNSTPNIYFSIGDWSVDVRTGDYSSFYKDGEEFNLTEEEQYNILLPLITKVDGYKEYKRDDGTESHYLTVKADWDDGSEVVIVC